MKKNLKKVISAVLALTLSLSSFVALSASAASFADVADTANYSEAVAALKALGAISGYEDGTFLPDNKITRAEAVTMIVAALNMAEDAKNSGSTTQFADVNANAAWAAGYVNVGVAQGFISGMSDTEFAPASNVTYAQMLSILTRILGYGDFAVSKGGYPNGYLTAASMAGILTGVSAAADTEVTRAQVAQLIWNAIQAPKLDITTFSTSASNSEMQKMDGKDDRDFKTVLSDNFDAYVLSVEVTGTSKAGDIEDAGYINMKLIGSNDWDPDLNSLVKNVSAANESKLTKSEVAVGNTDAESYPFSSAKVIAEYNDDDEWTLIYFAPTSKVVQKNVDGTLVKSVTAGTTTTNGVLAIKKSSTSSSTTDYKLTADAKLYVNGVEYLDITDANEAKVKALLEDSYGDTVLVESTKSGVYNKVMIDYYAVAKVNQVTAKSDRTKISLNTVTVNSVLDNPKTSFEVTADDLEDGTKAVSVVKGDAAVELSALAVDDVVAIRWNVKDTFDNSKFLDILATAETVTGKYTSYDEDDDEYTIGDAEYEAVPGRSFGLEFASTYTFRLDPLGRLFDADEEATSKNYAIVERFVETGASTSSEYDYISVMTLDGQQKTLYIEDDVTYPTGWDAKIDDTVKKTAAKTAIVDRIINYEIKNSTGRVKSIKWATDVVDGTTTEAEYNEDANRLGKPLTSNAVVLDATNYDSTSAKTSDYKASSLAALNNGTDYNYILVNKSTSTGEYSYVIITGAGAVFAGDSDFAVIAADASTSSKATVSDEDVYTVWAMENGESDAAKLNIATDAKVYFGTEVKAYAAAVEAGMLQRGTVFFYTTDEDGFADEIAVVMKGGYNFSDLLALTTTSLAKIELPATSDAKTIDTKDWKVQVADFRGDNEDIQLFLAPVYLAKSNAITFATITASDKAGVNGVNIEDSTYAYTLRDTSKVYAFDMSDSAEDGRYAFSNGAFSGIATSNLNSAKTYAYLGTVAEEVDNTETVQMAFVMVVDGVITNALVMSQN